LELSEQPKGIQVSKSLPQPDALKQYFIPAYQLISSNGARLSLSIQSVFVG